MYRFERNGEYVSIRGIKDLNKGDIVYVTTYADKIVEATVTRVRTIECATIITVKKTIFIDSTKYVGYHTDNYAKGNFYGSMLALDSYAGERLSKAWKKAEEKTHKDASRAEALYAMKVLRNWLRGNDEKAAEDYEFLSEM